MRSGRKNNKKMACLTLKKILRLFLETDGEKNTRFGCKFSRFLNAARKWKKKTLAVKKAIVLLLTQREKERPGC